MDKLNLKQAAFVREYIRDFNGTAAAGRAGYSLHTAKPQAARLLSKVAVQTAIKRYTDRAESAAVMDLTEACERITQIARDENDETAIKAVARLAKLLSWDAPTKIAPVTPDGLQPYQPALSHDEAAALYMEAMKRAVSRD